MVGILDLPAELMLHILWFLDLTDIISAQLSHRSLYSIIKGSVLLEYLTALKAAGMQDNRFFPIWSIYKRLQTLNCQENAWASRLIDFSRSISVPADLEFYSLNGGTCFFRAACSLHYFRLPSTISDEICWSRIDTDAAIIGFGFAIYEHDLIAIATQSFNGSQVLELLLLEASTGNPHPLAQHRRMSIAHPPLREIKIAGDNLATVAIYHGNYYRDYVDVYEWKTGILKMSIVASGGTYTDCLFISQNVLLVPNMRDNTFEFWDIPESLDVEQVCPRGALALPLIKHGSSPIHFTCKCESFIETYGTPHSSLPFHSSAADAIAVFDLVLQPNQFGAPVSRSTIFVHRRSLLDLFSMFPASPRVPGESFEKISWDKWGPPVTRLLTRDTPILHPYLASTCQRYAFPSGNREITVLDFNPIRIRHLKAVLPKYTEGEHEDMIHPCIIAGESCSYNMCLEPVISRLPYVRHVFQNVGAYNEVVIDDERLIGFSYTDNNGIRLEVLHIGQAASVSALQTKDCTTL